MSDHGYRIPTVPGGRDRDQGGLDALAAMAGRGGRAVHGARAAAGGLAARPPELAGGPPRPGPAWTACDCRASRKARPAAGQARSAARTRRVVAGVGQRWCGGGVQQELRRCAVRTHRGPCPAALLADAPTLTNTSWPCPMTGAGPAQGRARGLFQLPAVRSATGADCLETRFNISSLGSLAAIAQR